MKNILSAVDKRIQILKLFGFTEVTSWSLVLSSLRRRRSLSVTLGDRQFSVLKSEYDTFKEIYIDGEYAQCLQYSGVQHPNFIVDLGGNVGFATIYFLHLWPNVVVDVFEPIPETYDRLTQNLSGIDSVTLHRKSAGCENKDTFFTSDGPGSSSMKPPPDKGHDYVSCDEIDIFEFLDRDGGEGGGLLKVDIEGGEWTIFEDLRIDKLLEKFKVVIVEVHEFGDYFMSDFETKHIRRLLELGWKSTKVREIAQCASVYVLWRNCP
jgi:FkbM family methyltransferase